MKIVIISSILLLFLACSETQTLTPKRYSFAEITEKLSDEYADIIADIKADRQDDLKGERTRSFANDPFYQFYATMDEYDYHRIPLYELDLETFYSAPSEENIQRCIRPTNTVNLMAIKDGEIKIIFGEIVLKSIRKQHFHCGVVTPFGCTLCSTVVFCVIRISIYGGFDDGAR